MTRGLPSIAAVWLIAGCTPTGAAVSAPRIVAGNARIAEEYVTLRCDGERASVTCELDARYRLEPGPGESELVVGAWEHHTEGVTISGEPPLSSWTPPSDQLQRVARDVAADDEVHRRSMLQTPNGMAAWWRERAPEELRVRAQLVPQESQPWRVELPAALGRHHATSRWFDLEVCMYDDGGCQFQVEYLPARAQDRAPGHAVHFHAEGPDGWTMKGSGDRETDDPIVVTVSTGELIFAPGGPFFGYGASFDGAPKLKTRVGWEVFAPEHIGHAVALEIDADGQTAVALTSEIMSPSWLILPSVGFGFGLPVRLAPQRMSGARFQLSLQFPYVGATAVFDIFPQEPDWLSRSVYLNIAL